MKTKQMRRLADVAEHYGTGELRLTVWQNLIVPNVPDAFVETVKKSLVKMGFHYETSTISGGLVACTGNAGCKWAATNTKANAVALARYLEKKLKLDQPINIHLTGCPIPARNTTWGISACSEPKVGKDSAEGYHVFFGGGFGKQQAVAREVFHGISFEELPSMLEHVLQVYLARREKNESFAAFTRRHEVKQLQEMFSE